MGEWGAESLIVVRYALMVNGCSFRAGMGLDGKWLNG